MKKECEKNVNGNFGKPRNSLCLGCFALCVSYVSCIVFQINTIFYIRNETLNTLEWYITYVSMMMKVVMMVVMMMVAYLCK